jgi:ATP-dependent helicase HrpA
MNQSKAYKQYKQQHNLLCKQLTACYLFDRYPLKKQLDKIFSLLKKSLLEIDVKPLLVVGKATDINEQIRQSLQRCEKKIQRSLEKVAQRKKNVPQPNFPTALPVVHKLEQIKRLLMQHQVIIVAGETGSGKTTQLPKIALQAGRGIMGQIAHTQPRRLAARSVADRIAEELHSTLGNEVGFKVRFSDKSREQTYIKLMTDGILLAETQTDRFLNRYDTIIIDEAHERSLNIDFLLGYLKQLLPRRPDLKVIITSATIDTERFSLFFNQAPVVEVSGRTYPVEIRYHEPQEENTLVDGILIAVDELAMEADGDILVFLSGEREIREAAEALGKQHPEHTEILPLYARLSPKEQHRIFASHKGHRRIILATNVAETSLTVPGIRYVIDTGFARISRYSVRHKIQRLPIEKVSQASARQRSGRCGRVSDGIAIRLYSEEDHFQRPSYTEPELLRTNLAQVILQMLSLKLGNIDAFPFLEKPSDKQINDGFLLLEQLQAINGQRQLTAIGRSLARLSVDPKIARIIIAGQQHNVLAETLIIASALTCQDPRERPTDKRQAADEKHAQYASPRSDFLTFINLWLIYEDQRQNLSQNKLRQYCKSHFLSFMRMREWRELYQQLLVQTQDLKFRCNNLPQLALEQIKKEEDKLDYSAIHQALLTGFLGNIGSKDDNNQYLGARTMRFAIFPGSGLYKRKPKWLMAGEIVETSAIYARMVAAIEPLWLEQQAQHLVTHHYYDPFWEAKAGQVSAWSKVSLYGLVINARKKVNYGPIDPEVAQEIFIRDALVSGEYYDQNRKTPRFIKYNLALINELEHLEHKSRRQDLLVDDLAIFDFYQQRIAHYQLLQGQQQQPIYTRAAFEQWRKKIEQKEPEFLFLEQTDLLKKEVDHISDELYPATINNHDLQLPLEYHFLPGHALDGVTVAFPLAVINQLQEAIFEWLVPGLIREKITVLLRALPKVIRKQFVPIPNTVTEFLEYNNNYQEKLIGQLLTFLKNKLSYTLANQLDHQMSESALLEWQAKVPDHLMMNFKIVDKDGYELDSSRHLALLKQQWGEQALQQLELSQLTSDTHSGLTDIEKSIERQGLLTWDFDSLPESIVIERHGMTMTLYPALQDNQETVAIKLYDQSIVANRQHTQGIFRLLQLLLHQELKLLAKQLPQMNKICLLFTSYGSCDQLKQDMVEGILLDSIENQAISINEVRHQDLFFQLLLSIKASLTVSALDVSQAVLNALTANQILMKQLKGNIPFQLVPTLTEINYQQKRLIYPQFVSQTPLIWLKRFPRYCKAMGLRLDKAKNDPQRDKLNQLQMTPLWDQYEKKIQEGVTPFLMNSELQEYRWLLEELRISLFAQELKTAQPVSVKRLEKKWRQMNQ